MVDVFVSYSRKDTDFVKKLHNALAAQNRDTWVDWEDIPASAEWWKEIEGGIESSDAFAFIISPDSVRSEVCRREIEFAVTNNKRFIPVLHRPVTDPEDQKLVHPSISSHNWIFFRDGDDFDKQFKLFISSLDTDLSYVRAHTRILVRAREWEDRQRNSSYLLQGDDLKMAEGWLAESVTKKPDPTPIHGEYIHASRQAATASQRRLLAGVTAALIVSLILAALALAFGTEARRQEGIALNNASTATIAQGRAEINAVTATVAQGQAEINAATATVAQGQAEINAITATVAQGQAEFSASTAVAERNNAQSIAQAAQAQIELNGPKPDRAALLALASIQNYGYTWQAERALALAVQPDLAANYHTLSGHTGEVKSVDWRPTGRDNLLLTTSDDDTARIWGVDGSELYKLIGHTGNVNHARWSPDGKHIVTVSDDTTAKVWSVEGNYSGLTVTLEFTLTGHNGPVRNLAWSADSQKVVTVSNDRTAIVWDVATGTAITMLSGHEGIVNAAAFSPADSTRVVTVGDDATVRVWDATNGTLLNTLNKHQSAVSWVAWSADGSRFVTTSRDNTARIWDAEGQELFVLQGHVRAVNWAAWAPPDQTGHSTRLATISGDGTARIWNAENGELLKTLFGHEDEIRGLAWSPGGSRLLTVSRDGTARMWYTESGGQLLTFSGHGDNGQSKLIYSVAWSPDGRYFATAGADGTARVWQIWKNAAQLISFARSCCNQRILSDEENQQFGLPTATPAPSPTPQPAICGGEVLDSRLYRGARGRVAGTGDDTTATSIFVHTEPGIATPRIGRVALGQTFVVLEGPQCFQNIAWFRVIFGISAIEGWIAEGEDGAYYLEPVG